MPWAAADGGRQGQRRETVKEAAGKGMWVRVFVIQRLWQ
jgi:hypothetical protein